MSDQETDRNKAIRTFFMYIQNKYLTHTEGATTGAVRNVLNNGYQLMESRCYTAAFELLCEELVKSTFTLDNKIRQLVIPVLFLSGPNEAWKFDFRKLMRPGYINGSWRLIDGEAMAKANKYTIYKPSRTVTEQLKVENEAKLQFDYESTKSTTVRCEIMWVKITKIGKRKMEGVLINMPVHIHELCIGDIIKFGHKHIIGHNLKVQEPSLANKYFIRCFVSKKIVHDHLPINVMYREKPMPKEDEDEIDDSGWNFLSGHETEEYLNNSNNGMFTTLGSVLGIDDSFIELLDSKAGSSFERNKQGQFEVMEE